MTGDVLLRGNLEGLAGFERAGARKDLSGLPKDMSEALRDLHIAIPSGNFADFKTAVRMMGNFAGDKRNRELDCARSMQEAVEQNILLCQRLMTDEEQTPTTAPVSTIHLFGFGANIWNNER